MNSHNNLARTFGVFFILTFISYGSGSALIDTITSSPLMLVNVYENQTAYVIGIILMTLVHTLFNIGLPLLMLPIMKPYNLFCSYGYLSFAIIATMMLNVGGLILLLILPLSIDYASTDFATLGSIELMANLLQQGGYYAYYLGMSFWATGSLLFTFTLYQSGLIPRVMSIWGALGYLILFLGSLSQLFAHNAEVEVNSMILGGAFEVALSFWLIVKGFNHEKTNAEVGLAQ
mgnify:CR=1 FL=1